MRLLLVWVIHQITRRQVPEYRNIIAMTSNITTQCFGCEKLSVTWYEKTEWSQRSGRIVLH